MGGDLTRDVGGLNIRRVRRAPAIQNDLDRIFYKSLTVDVEPGIAPEPTAVGFTMASSGVPV